MNQSPVVFDYSGALGKDYPSPIITISSICHLSLFVSPKQHSGITRIYVK